MSRTNKNESVVIANLLDGSLEKINMMLNTVWDGMDEEERSLIAKAGENIAEAKKKVLAAGKE